MIIDLYSKNLYLMKTNWACPVSLVSQDEVISEMLVKNISTDEDTAPEFQIFLLRQSAKFLEYRLQIFLHYILTFSMFYFPPRLTERINNKPFLRADVLIENCCIVMDLAEPLHNKFYNLKLAEELFIYKSRKF